MFSSKPDVPYMEFSKCIEPCSNSYKAKVVVLKKIKKLVCLMCVSAHREGHKVHLLPLSQSKLPAWK